MGTNIFSLPTPSEPFANEIFIVEVSICRVPERHPKLVGTIQDGETFGRWSGRTIEAGKDFEHLALPLRCGDMTHPSSIAQTLATCHQNGDN